MSFYHKFLSYLNVIPVRKYESVYNGTLEINWLNGRKVLDTHNTNYSYGNLGKVLHKALTLTKTDFIHSDTEILILGLGGGDVVKQFRNHFKSHANITAVEIDPVIIEIAVNEFHIIPDSRLEILKEDAELFLKYNQKKFDLIIVDLFFDMNIPEFVFQKSFIQSIYRALHIHGSAIFNTFILEDWQEERNDRFADMLKDYFSLQSLKRLYGHNHLLIAQRIK